MLRYQKSTDMLLKTVTGPCTHAVMYTHRDLFSAWTAHTRHMGVGGGGGGVWRVGSVCVCGGGDGGALYTVT